MYESTDNRWVQKTEVPEDYYKCSCVAWNDAIHIHPDYYRQQCIKYELHNNRWVQGDCVMDSRPLRRNIVSFQQFEAAIQCNGKLYWLNSWQQIAELDPQAEHWRLVHLRFADGRSGIRSTRTRNVESAFILA
jgi:hypothetical protein